MEKISMNTENSKTSEPHKFVLSLLQRLDLKSLNKHIALQNLPIYNIRKNVGQQYKNNKLKIIFPTWNNDFELPDSSYSVPDTQDYKKMYIT